MSSKRYRGRFVWQPPEKLSFQGTPQNRDQWFELSREQLLSMWRDFKGLPIRQLHGSVPIGRVLSPFWDADGSAMIEFEFDNTPEATFTRSLLDNNLMRGLSLKHNPNSTYPIEISLCFEGARPNTWVTGATETKDATYKPTDTFIPVQQQSLELLAETTPTAPMQQQTSHVAASMQQIPMQTVAQSVAQGQSPVGGYVPPAGIADPMYQHQQQPPPQQQQQQQQQPPPQQQPLPADNDAEMMDVDAETPALDEIIKSIVEKQGPLSAKEKVLLLKSMQKTKRQVETATSELQEQQQQNNQLKSHYLDAILGWIERTSGTSTDEGDRQSLNTLFNSPEGAKFLASSTGNRFLVSASKAALVPDFKTKEQIEEERYNKYLTRMLQQTQAPGTSVSKSVAASSSSKPPMQNVQASNSFPFTPDEFRHAFAAPLRVSTSSLTNSGNLQPVRPYLPNVAASGSAGNAPPAKTFYTSAELGWKYVPGSIKIPAFTKELLEVSKTRALDQVDMTVTVPKAREQRSGLFANNL